MFIPLHISIKNFRRVGDTPLTHTFTKKALMVHSDVNGAGKTTIFVHAPFYALYGIPYNKGAAVDSLINFTNKKHCLVEYIFHNNGAYVKVVRGRKMGGKTKNPFSFYVIPDVFEEGYIPEFYESDLVPIVKGAKYQSMLQELVGIEAKTFIQLSIISPNQYIPYRKMPLDGRTKLLDDIIGSAGYRQLEKAIRADFNALKSEANTLEHDLELRNTRLEGVERTYKASETLLVPQIHDLQAKVKTVSETLAMYDTELTTAKNAMEAELTDQGIFDDWEVYRAELDLWGKRTDKELAINKCKADIAVIEQEANLITSWTEVYNIVVANATNEQQTIALATATANQEVTKQKLESSTASYTKQIEVVAEAKLRLPPKKGATHCTLCGTKLVIHDEDITQHNYITQEEYTRLIDEKNQYGEWVKKDREALDSANLKVQTLRAENNAILKEIQGLSHVTPPADTSEFTLENMNMKLGLLEGLVSKDNIAQKELHTLNNEMKGFPSECPVKPDSEEINEWSDIILDRHIKTITELQTLIKAESEKPFAAELEQVRTTYSGLKNTYILEAQELRNDITTLEERIATHYEKFDIVKDSYNTLNTHNMRATLVKSFLPLINTTINEYLQRMGFYIRIQIDETMNIEVISSQVAGISLNDMSDGEMAKIDVAILIAFREVTSKINNVDSRLFILDDIWGNIQPLALSELIGALVRELPDNGLVVIVQDPHHVQEHFHNHLLLSTREGFTVKL